MALRFITSARSPLVTQSGYFSKLCYNPAICGTVPLQSRFFASSTRKGGNKKLASEDGDSKSAADESVSPTAVVRRGGEVPQFPTVLALPLPRRPLFPGQHAAINISHPAIGEAMMKLYQSGHPYVGTFLLTRAVSESGATSSGEESGVTPTVDSAASARKSKPMKPSSSDETSSGVFDELSEMSDDEAESVLEKKTTSSGARIVTRVSDKIGSMSGPSSKPTHTDTSTSASREVISDPFKELFQVGCLAKIEQIVQGSPHRKSASMFVVLSGVRRIEIVPDKMVGLEVSKDGLKDVSEEMSEDVSSSVSVPCYVSVAHWLEGKTGGASAPSSADDIMTKALVNETISLVRQIAAINPLFKEQIDFIRTATDKVDLSEPGRIADFATTITTASALELQQILEEKIVTPNRLQKSLYLLRKELETSQLQAKIGKEVEEKMNKQHREYFLREQMKVIRKELGMEKDDKESLIEKFRKRMENYSAEKIPSSVTQVFNDEIEKLQSLDKNSSEFNVTRGYLDWVSSIPWGNTSVDSYNLTEAKKVLDEDHYGLTDVKDRILELIAVGKLRGPDLGLQGKIICLQGPPGVGKTSVAKSIARALHREYYRFSVGGLYDVSEIKGHRRTYVGAMPGKIAQCLKLTKMMNPLILIDEIDKLAHGGAHGDPASALLEVLDPSQNNSFMDHYLDLPLDLSSALFVCTANQLETIPAPLRDRMEIITLSGYDIPEKVAIAKNYLIPKTMKNCGLTTVSVADTAIEQLIRGYAREAGVRTLEKYIERIMRKISLKSVQEKEKIATEILLQGGVIKKDSKDLSSDMTKYLTFHGHEIPCASIPVGDLETTVRPDNLQEIIGKAPYPSEKIYEATSPPPGVVMGLAWTSVGGTCLYVEAVTVPCVEMSVSDSSKPAATGGRVEVTGQLGSVMNESSKIALTVAKRSLFNSDQKNDFFVRESIHLHFPEGATPKDGPSAGVTMATSLLSLATNTPVPEDVAMTGELSITGLVLPVGGIKEKTIAAKRAGIKRLCLPEANKRDVVELPEYLKEGIEIHHFSHFSDLAKFVLGISTRA